MKVDQTFLWVKKYKGKWAAVFNVSTLVLFTYDIYILYI